MASFSVLQLHCRIGVRLCRTGVCFAAALRERCAPHSFSSCEKECAAPGTRKSRLWCKSPVHPADLAAAQIPGCYSATEVPPQHPRRAFRSATRSCRSRNSGRFALYPRVGNPKGRAAARPFESFQGGLGGNRNPPRISFWTGCLRSRWRFSALRMRRAPCG